MIVRDAMTDYFASANIRSTVGDAMEKMLSEGLDVLLIVDDSSKLVGSLREPFLMEALLDQQLQDDLVSLHMESDSISAAPDELITSVIEKFQRHQTSEFPVVVRGLLAKSTPTNSIVDSLWHISSKYKWSACQPESYRSFSVFEYAK